MGPLIGTIAFIFTIIWAFRIESNTRNTSDSLKRIEQLLEEMKEKK